MNCRDALRLLYDIVDKEASQIDAEEVEKHLKTCRHCLAHYEFEQMFKAFVIKRGENARDNEYLKNRIKIQLDSIDAAREVSADRNPFRWAAVSFAIAASIILCIVAAFTLSDYYHIRTEIYPFIEAHYTYHPENSIESEDSDPFVYLYEQTGIKLEHPLQLPSNKIRSVSVDTIRGIEFGHLELMGENDAIISIFVTQKDRYELPHKPVESINGCEMLVHCCKKCNVVGVSKGDLIFVLVARPDCKPDKLAELSSYF